MIDTIFDKHKYTEMFKWYQFDILWLICDSLMKIIYNIVYILFLININQTLLIMQ